ncbi:hypothetical protein PybrP1_004974 [[Pythium] brassicae (nom. inval.)]|nr:hypothetical protein PybrP1_004974 [[Pythium] brassicae (nom. inval.)]
MGGWLAALLALALALALCVAGADAAVVAGFEWTNATAGSTADLHLQIDVQDAHVPADAQLLFTFSNRVGVPPTTIAVDAPTLNEVFDVELTDHAVAITRRGDGSELPSASVLRFTLRGLQTPARAGSFAVGTLAVSDASQTPIFQVALPTVLITPGAIWNARVAFGALLSGRAATLRVEVEPATAIPDDGALIVTLPDMYGSLASAALESAVGLDGAFTLVSEGNQMSVTRVKGTGTATTGAQLIVLQVSGIMHPLLEGPIGNQVRVDTVDGEKLIINQVYVDTAERIVNGQRVYTPLECSADRNSGDGRDFSDSQRQLRRYAHSRPSRVHLIELVDPIRGRSRNGCSQRTCQRFGVRAVSDSNTFDPRSGNVRAVVRAR